MPKSSLFKMLKEIIKEAEKLGDMVEDQFQSDAKDKAKRD